MKSGTFEDESGDGFAQPGETISYTFSVTNSGNVTLTDVTLADTVGGVTISGGPIATLAVGAVDTTTFSGSYAITQADIDAGAFLNTATVTGTDPNDQPVSDDDSHTEPLPQDPELTLVKSSTTTSIVVAGQVVPYSYLLTNTGNVTISALSVSDDNVDAPAVCVETTLAPAESTTCSASHTVTQAELDANGSPTPDSGVLTNVAIATGTPAGGTLTDPTDSLDIPIVQAPELTLVKSSTTTSIVVAGQVVPYSYLLTNTGNVTISALSVSDDNVDAPAVCVETTLAPAESTTCSASHTVTQAELDANGSPTPDSGVLTNVAIATGTPAGGTLTDPTDSLDIPIVQDPELTLLKSGTFEDESGDGFAQPGETISYTFSVTNSGNVTLTDVTLADTVGGVTISGGPIATLAVGAVDTTTFSGSYAITQADIDAGAFLNTATVTGTDPNDQPVSDDDSHTEPLPQDPELTLLKSGTFTDESGDGFAQPGETISYTFSVTNSGNVTLTDVTLADTVGGVTISGGPIATLAVGAVDTTTFSGSYAITQADIDAGAFLNTATVTGTDPNDQPVSDDDSHTEPLPQDPELTLRQVGHLQDESGDGFAQPGETISYTFSVTNSGNVTLTDVTLADTVGGVTISGGPIATLAVGAVDTTTFSGSYAITQADIDAGAFLNTATVTGTDPNDQPVSDDDSHTEPLPQDPELTLLKSGTFTDESGDGFAQPGETISYTFSVTNSGNVTLTDVTLADTVGGVTISGGPIATLAVGAVDTTTFSGSYAITQADIDAGAFLNTATVTGTDSNDQPVSDDDSHTEPLPQDPELTLLKSGTFRTRAATASPSPVRPSATPSASPTAATSRSRT